MIFVLQMLFTLFMIVRTEIIGHYSSLVTHYSLLVIQTPSNATIFVKFEERLNKYESNENCRLKSHISTSEHYYAANKKRKSINHLSVTRNN